MKIKTYDDSFIDLPLSGITPEANLVALPALIDLHVHFRCPGQEYKEDWRTGALAALAGGVTTVCDMPNNVPAITTMDLLQQKIRLVTEQLAVAAIPLRHYFYFGATVDNLEEIRQARADKNIIGSKVFMGSSTGNLLVKNRDDQRRLFALSTELNLPLALHAEDEATIEQNKTTFPHPTLADHSLIRSPLAAARALESALELATEYKNTIYVLHTSTAAEMELLRQAKKSGIKVFAETTPHHLFLTSDDYDRLGAKAQMNPPLREAADQAALWEAVLDGTIDTVATDHAPHTLAEKNVAYPGSPSGVPGIETMLPLLINAYHEGMISLRRIVELTHTNPQTIFNLPETSDWVVVDLNATKTIQDASLKTKCGWSPFSGRTLTGWPIATILDDTVFTIK